MHAPLVVRISVYQGHLHGGFKEAKALACAVAERWYMAPGVQRVSVNENGIRGMLFLPPGEHGFRVISYALTELTKGSQAKQPANKNHS